MDVRITAKLFHTVVVVGMGLAASGCGGDDSPSTSGGSSGTTSSTTGAVADNTTDAGHVDSGTTTGTGTSSGGDKMPSWSCCA